MEAVYRNVSCPRTSVTVRAWFLLLLEAGDSENASSAAALGQ